ncbi:MAG: copper amine oxidase N-terminal domain-containing protein [Firmicutes bacterium]|nr:copper amine oxidase N-terminal domain-containing protein [Bacillota bacterium]
MKKIVKKLTVLCLCAAIVLISSVAGAFVTVKACWGPLESALQTATDVVIVQYVGSRLFGQYLTEFEFTVVERILGNAADRIFVYANFTDDGRAIVVSTQISGLGLTFNRETNYLLPLITVDSPYSNIRDGGFAFVQYAVFDLCNPQNSVSLGRPLSESRLPGLNVSSTTSGHEIVTFITELTRDNPPANDFIRSTAIEDIVHGSPYIFVVEIARPMRLSHEQVHTGWRATDLYYVTVIQTLKGNFSADGSVVVVFHADTVLPGERHIVAVQPLSPGSTWFNFTSRNSLFRMEYLDEIVDILNRPSSLVLQFTAGDIKFIKNGIPHTGDAAAFIDTEFDRMMIPLRTFAEATGSAVGWNRDTHSAKITPPSGEVLTVRAGAELPNGMGTAVIVDGHMFIPLRYVMYSFNATVEWDGSNRSGIITVK